ncbi:hypothetical protein OFC24_28430, partial [Escherichia coli]|nr:hypothetical protein [Escherichia coli]
MVFVWKQNYILVDEYFFFCCTWIVNSALKHYVDKGEYLLVLAKDLFGIPEMDPKMAVPVFKTKTSYRAPLNKDYIPNPRILEQVVKLLISPD